MEHKYNLGYTTFLQTLGNCLPTKDNVIAVPISEQDQELIRKFTEHFQNEKVSYLQDTNATVIAVYKSIVDHKIADETILKMAQDCLNEWNHSPRKFPSYSHFENMESIYYSTTPELTEKRNAWNRWTSGSFDEIFIKLDQASDQNEESVIKMMHNTVRQLSDSAKSRTDIDLSLSLRSSL